MAIVASAKTAFSKVADKIINALHDSGVCDRNGTVRDNLPGIITIGSGVIATIALVYNIPSLILK